MLTYITWDIDPFIRIGDFFAIRWYSLLFALAIVYGYQITRWFFIREQAPGKEFHRVLIVIFVGGLIGARLTHVIFYDPQYFLEQPWYILKIWEGGLASHGAAVGMIAGVYLYARYLGKIWYWWIYDRLAIALAPGAALIRIGNLMNSELYGKVTEAPWAFVFLAVDPLPRHPVQLYEVAYLVIIFGIMMTLYRYSQLSKKFGMLSGIFLILLTLFRIGAEFFKSYETVLGGLNMGQLLSLPFLGLGILLVIMARRGKFQ